MATATPGFASTQEVYAALIRNGASSDVAQTLAAITRPESSGHTSALGHYQGNSFQGLFQIGSFWSTDPRLLSDDIDYQAQMALQIYHQQGYQAWETYTNGSYQKYLGEADPNAAGLQSLTPVLGAGFAGAIQGGLTNGVAAGAGGEVARALEEGARARSTFLAQGINPTASPVGTAIEGGPLGRPPGASDGPDRGGGTIQGGHAFEKQFIPDTGAQIGGGQ